MLGTKPAVQRCDDQPKRSPACDPVTAHDSGNDHPVGFDKRILVSTLRIKKSAAEQLSKTDAKRKLDLSRRFRGKNFSERAWFVHVSLRQVKRWVVEQVERLGFQ